MAVCKITLSGQGLRHATLVGRVVLPVLFFVRVLTLALAERSVWELESSQFICNTQQPGCNEVCYNAITFIIHPHYWFFQLILVTFPTIIYMGTSISKSQSPTQSNASKEEWVQPHFSVDVTNTAGSCETTISPCFYIFTLIFKLIVEAGCLLGQWYLIGFRILETFFCAKPPCSHSTDCFVPNSGKKTFIIIVMAVLTGVSLLLIMLELFLVLTKKMCTK
ncbi:gap junction alpha-2 protein-like [Pelobates fuscus]|uniref:gap junction alpha-2 protein-like n=1 Tax=Pelobates fuscus TaxID=191477 RepID=UPI002FE436F1